MLTQYKNFPQDIDHVKWTELEHSKKDDSALFYGTLENTLVKNNAPSRLIADINWRIIPYRSEYPRGRCQVHLRVKDPYIIMGKNGSGRDWPGNFRSPAEAWGWLAEKLTMIHLQEPTHEDINVSRQYMKLPTTNERNNNVDGHAHDHHHDEYNHNHIHEHILSHKHPH